MRCPANPASSAESGSPTTGPSPKQELEACLILLINALAAQTKAINRLAQSNEMLVQAMAEADDGEPAAPTQYMNGRPIA